MTKMLTDDDLRVIEDLDFEPGCEFGEVTAEGLHPAPCGRGASWITHGTSACGCHFSRLLCDGHLPDYLDVFQRGAGSGFWFCSSCDALGLPVAIIDRIEPLR